jgi:hypothetical protein
VFIERRNVFNILRLVETTGQAAKYAALSHCWGKHQPIRTLKTNMADMKKVIAWNDLSQVFKNAVQVCYSLGIEYLWIDSLCIVQDDKGDWELESSKMADYYENAFITISATMSSDGTQPFLIERDSKWLPEKFSLIGHDESTEVLVRRHQGSSLNSEMESFGPIISRAWVWQEMILSTRVLHYTQSELIWDCKTEVLSEDGLRPYSILAMRLPRQLERCKKDPRFGWHNLLSTYTARQLTFETDRLPALSGISSRFQSLVGSSFAAGLWKCDLPFDLCWEADNQAPGATIRPASSDKIAPSWSWASVNGPIFFHDFNADDVVEPMCVVEDVQCNVLGKNPFGRVKDGYVRLRGTLAHIQIDCSEPTNPDTYTIGSDPNEREPLMVDCMLAVSNGKPKRATKADQLAAFSAVVPCMLVFRHENEGDSAYHVLVLGQIDRDRYNRLGIANLDGMEWFEQGVMTTIDIV